MFLASLWHHCTSTDWTGWDPYDGLMATRWPATWLRATKLTRLVLIQGMKRSPINLRPLLGVPKLRNPKAMALGLESACRLVAVPSWADEARAEARRLAVDLCDAAVRTPAGHGWGYPFDWQARAFWIPRNAPTVVCSGFVVRALDHARHTFADDPELRPRIEAAIRGAMGFVLHDLHRTNDEHGFCWSYSPLDRSAVVNASLLGAETLARGLAMDASPQIAETAGEAVRWALSRQSDEGGWAYGEAGHHTWEDSFHTGFNIASLLAIHEAARATGEDPEIFLPRERIERAYAHYARTFFDPDGRPWYYSHTPWPIDPHAAAVAVLTHLAFADEDAEAQARAERTLTWTNERMWVDADDEDADQGFYAFQMKGRRRIEINYLRWCQAWMLRALAEREVRLSGAVPRP